MAKMESWLQQLIQKSYLMSKTNSTPHIININHTSDNILSFLEADDIGFVPHRIYYLKNLDTKTERGFHAHKKLKQVIIAMSGSFDIELEGNNRTYSFPLNNSNKALYIPPGYYRIFRNFTKDAVCLVLASEKYEEEDYIRDYKKFKAWEKSSTKVTKVDYTHIDRELNFLGPSLHLSIKNILYSKQLILGPNVQKFEEEFANYCCTKYAIAVANGIDAIRLILKALNISHGDEVIIPSHTYIATALAVHDVGAKPIFIDNHPDTYNIDPGLIESAITKDTKAIIPVHMHGLPCYMSAINEIAKKFNLKVIEDSAQAHGATFNHKKCGSFSDAAAFSLYPTKNLGCYGDGGIITTSDKSLAEKLYALRNYGSTIRYQHELPGVNSRLDEMQAAILLLKLPHLDMWNMRRIQIAKKYIDSLKHLTNIILPITPKGMQHIYHHFVIRLKSKHLRDQLQQHLCNHNIATMIHYPTPLHLEQLFKTMSNSLPNLIHSEEFSNTALSLPISPFLKDEEVEYVICHLINFSQQQNII